MMKTYIFFFVLFIGLSGKAQNYILDNSFGTSGAVVTNYNMYYDNNQAPSNCFYVNNRYIFVQKTQVSAFNYQGNVDFTFGTNGYSRLVHPMGITIRNSKLIGNDIYLCGLISNNYLTFYGFIAKMDINGVIDTSFGTNGIATFTFGSLQNGVDVGVYDFAFKDGSIFAVGTSYINPNNRIFVAKLSSNGILDASFDPNGYKTYPIFSQDEGHGIFVYEDDLLVVAGAKMNYTAGVDQYDSAIVFIKIDESGNYVAGFGTNGVKKKVVCDACAASSDRIRIPTLIGDEVYLNRNHYEAPPWQGGYIQKLNINTLALTGIGSVEDDSKAAYLIDGDKIYTLGCNHSSPSCGYNFYIRRRNLDGSLDLTFNQTGDYQFSFPQNSIDYATVAIKHSDNGIMIAGYTDNNVNDIAPNKGFAMIRIKDEALASADFSVQNNFSVYPNPTRDKLNIQNNNNRTIDNISISDVFGKTIFENKGHHTMVDMTQLAQGLYFLKIAAEGSVEYIKIIKQ